MEYEINLIVMKKKVLVPVPALNLAASASLDNRSQSANRNAGYNKLNYTHENVL